jgi:hypothetical protein
MTCFLKKKRRKKRNHGERLESTTMKSTRIKRNLQEGIWLTDRMKGVRSSQSWSDIAKKQQATRRVRMLRAKAEKQMRVANTSSRRVVAKMEMKPVTLPLQPSSMTCLGSPGLVLVVWNKKKKKMMMMMMMMMVRMRMRVRMRRRRTMMKKRMTRRRKKKKNKKKSE